MFKRFVEVGRVVLLKDGPDADKPAVIVEIVDHNRVMVDGPTTGVSRKVVSFRHVKLTDHTVAIPRGARTGTVKKFVTENETMEKFFETSVAKKIASKAVRVNLSDFDRFKVMVLKRQVFCKNQLYVHKDVKMCLFMLGSP